METTTFVSPIKSYNKHFILNTFYIFAYHILHIFAYHILHILAALNFP